MRKILQLKVKNCHMSSRPLEMCVVLEKRLA